MELSGAEDGRNHHPAPTLGTNKRFGGVTLNVVGRQIRLETPGCAFANSRPEPQLPVARGEHMGVGDTVLFAGILIPEMLRPPLDLMQRHPLIEPHRTPPDSDR